MKIDEYFNQSNFVNELSHLNNLLASAQANITSWGKRVITVPGYEDSVLLDTITENVLTISHLRSIADDLTNNERVVGIEIIDKIRTFYKITDTTIKDSDWYTRLLNSLQEFALLPYTPRFYIEEGVMEYTFRGYSEDKFIQEFGICEGKIGDHPDCEGRFSPPIRIVAREASIRSKLLKI